MFNGGFTDLLLLALAAILIVAAVIDMRTFTISNRLNATVAAGAPLYWLSIAMAPWPGMAVQLAAGGIVFVLLAGAFYAVPRPLRDALYRFVARRRYRWFGKRESCMVPTPETADRFLT